MGARYSVGSKVRIKPEDFIGRILDPQISQYENMTGEIIESANIVAFVRPINLMNSGERITVYHYTVKINEQTILHDVLEECLEISN
jgi:hypothetical protein